MKADLSALYDAVSAKLALCARLSAALASAAQRDAHDMRPYFKRPDKGRGALGSAPPRPRSRGACRTSARPMPGRRASRAAASSPSSSSTAAGSRRTSTPSSSRSTSHRPRSRTSSSAARATTPNQHLNDPEDPDFEVTMDIQIAGAAYYFGDGTAGDHPRLLGRRNATWARSPRRFRRPPPTAATSSRSPGARTRPIGRRPGQQTGVDYVGQLNAAAQAATNAGHDRVRRRRATMIPPTAGRPRPMLICLRRVPMPSAAAAPRKLPTSETVWNNDPGNPSGNGTGGGYSTLFPPQPWQAGAPQGPGRMVPDVAADADPYTGYELYVHGAGVTLGGTSAVSPLYAGLFAAFGEQARLCHPEAVAQPDLLQRHHQRRQRILPRRAGAGSVHGARKPDRQQTRHLVRGVGGV